MYFQCVTDSGIQSWYELGVCDGGRCLEITLTLETWRIAKAALMNPRIRKHVEPGGWVPRFIMPGLLPWGFGPSVMHYEDTSEGVGTIRCELPQWSEGIADSWWPMASGTCVTLSAILDAIQHAQEQSGTHLLGYQLLEVAITVQRDQDRYYFALSAGIASELWAKLQRLPPDTILPSTTAYMRIAYQQLHGHPLGEFDKDATNARVREQGRLSLNCPGDRCGLIVHQSSCRPGVGYEMFDHNLDSPTQVLTLLTGLAALCQEVKQL